MSKISVIGSGFAGLSAASFLAKEGHEVTIFEKNSTVGGRARSFEAKGFTFDMGPSWYWMPDVFEKYFRSFGREISEFYNLKRLDPSYRVFDSEKEVDIPADMQGLYDLFESYEKGSSKHLEKFLNDAEYKYKVGINQLVYQPGVSILEFVKPEVFKGLLKLNLLKSVSSEIRNKFKNPFLQKLLEFPSLFLGAKPENTPSLYSLMNYADLKLGTWYPMGGMHKIIEGMEKVALDLGVSIQTESPVQGFEFRDKNIVAINTSKGSFETDVVVSGADYAHTESILPLDKRNYSDKYWKSRTLAPSALIYYMGIDKEVKGLLHHNLFFDEPFSVHAEEIYDDPKWPSAPLFYVCAPTKTDKSVAPEGKENIFILMPLAPDLEDGEELREIYFEKIITRLEKRTGESIKDHLLYKKSYSISNFKEDYNSLRGNAYGLANTLKQTAILKPSIKNKKVSNLFYTGQLTVPGPGVPPSLISGEVACGQVIKYMEKNKSKAIAIL